MTRRLAYCNGVLTSYHEVYTPAVLDALDVLAPLNHERRELMAQRIARRHRRRTTSYPIAPAQIPACGFPAPGSSEILASASGFKSAKHSAASRHAARHQYWSSVVAYP